MKAEMGILDTGSNKGNEQQILDLNNQLVAARSDVEEKRARLEQARRLINTNGDIQSIPELTASAVLTALRQKQTELNWRASDLQNKVGERHGNVIALRAELAGLNKQITAEAEHILGNMQNAHDIAMRREQSLETNLRKLSSALGNSDTYVKLQQLRRVADADRKLYESYLSQYNEISQRRTLQDASARLIWPPRLPRLPSSSRRMLCSAVGGVGGLGSGFLLVLPDIFRSGVKNGREIEQTSGRPVL